MNEWITRNAQKAALRKISIIKQFGQGIEEEKDFLSASWWKHRKAQNSWLDYESSKKFIFLMGITIWLIASYTARSYCRSFQWVPGEPMSRKVQTAIRRCRRCCCPRLELHRKPSCGWIQSCSGNLKTDFLLSNWSYSFMSYPNSSPRRSYHLIERQFRQLEQIGRQNLLETELSGVPIHVAV